MEDTTLYVTGPNRPRFILRTVEDYAVKIRKLLVRGSSKEWAEQMKLVDDAVKMAEVLEALSRYRHQATAEEAIYLADRAEALSELLAVKVDSLLALTDEGV